MKDSNTGRCFRREVKQARIVIDGGCQVRHWAFEHKRAVVEVGPTDADNFTRCAWQTIVYNRLSSAAAHDFSDDRIHVFGIEVGQ